QHCRFARHGQSVPASLSISRLDSASLHVTRVESGREVDGAMAGDPPAFGFAARLAAFYAALFVLTGVHLPFFPVWLAAKGLDPTLIGVALALPMLVRVLAIPLATRAADRRDAVRATLVLASLATLAGYLVLGF